MRMHVHALALAMVAAAAGCTLPGASGPLYVHVLNERPAPVDVTVEVDGAVVYETGVGTGDTGDDVRASDPIEVEGRKVRVVVGIQATGEAKEAMLDLSDGRHLVVAIGPSSIRLSLHERTPAFA